MSDVTVCPKQIQNHREGLPWLKNTMQICKMKSDVQDGRLNTGP